jgi:mxaJ protein
MTADFSSRAMTRRARATKAITILAGAIAGVIVPCVFLGAASRAEDVARSAASPGLLRVCAAANEAPYSMRGGLGFENRIAEAVAAAMGRKAEFVWSSEPAMYAVRDQLEMQACDMIVGLDSGDARVLTTRPYYRAPYVFIQRRDTALNITSWDSPDIIKAANIGFVPGTPAQTMLEKIGIFREHYNYMHSLADYKVRGAAPVRIPPTRLVADVADGKAELAVAFAPQVARYVKASDKLVMTVVPDTNVRADGIKIPHHFDQSIGVRKTDIELLAALDIALEKARPRIEEILKEEGIPLLGAAPRS